MPGFFMLLFLSLEESDDEEKHNGADDGRDNLADDCGTPVDADPLEEVAADVAADDTYEDVDEEAESGTLDDLASKETCDGTDQNC